MKRAGALATESTRRDGTRVKGSPRRALWARP